MKLIKRLIWTITVAIGTLVLLLTLVSTVSADPPVSWYVSPGGADAPGCGSAIAPCLTINYAIGEAITGSTVIIMPGVYTQTATLSINKPITLAAQNGAGSAVVAGDGSVARVILIESDGVTLSELEVRNGSGDVIRQSASYTGTVITGTIVHDCGDECVQLARCTDCLIENVIAYDTAQDGLNFADSRNSTIRNCEVYDSRSENGAIFVYGSSSITIENNYVHDSTASNGIYIEEMDGEGTTLLHDNVIEDNNFSGRNPSQISGVAILVYKPLAEPVVDARIVIAGNRIENNTGDDNAAPSGHAIYWIQHAGYDGAPVEILSNRVISNGGDGIHVEVRVAHTGTVTVTGNSILNNAGRGIAVDNTGTLTATVRGNTIVGNGDDADRGGGVYVRGTDPILLVNNIVAANNLSGTTGLGAGLYVTDTRIILQHTTIAENAGGDGAGLYLGGTSTAVLTNTIIVSHTVGVTVAASSTATLNATLWHGNGDDSGGSGTVISSANVSGAPAFFGGGDYHITLDSAAIDAGVDAGVTADLDGDPRPLLSGHDLGADEAPNVDEIALVASPAGITANGLTTTTLTATVKYKGALQDGVPVVFTTSLGLFSNWAQTIVVTTTQGVAVTWLRSVPAGGAVTSTVEASFSNTFTETQVAFTPNTCRADLTSWTEHAADPIFGQGVDGGPKAYYPSILFSPTAFDGHGDGAYYKMWFGTSSGKTGYAISDDGLDWITVSVPLTDINGYHAHVLYDADQFSGHGDAAYYKMWYWDVSNSINYATSTNGIDWTDYPGNPVITNTLGSGSAPVYDAYVIYNSDGNPAFYEAWIDNNGKIYYITSTNGITWTGDNRELLADRAGWEASTYSRASVLKLDDAYHMWYGGADGGGGNHGIGYAVSPDGRHWVKSVDNPILHKDDSVSWRDSRTYTPRVLYSATRFDGHGTPEQYKMWFTGKDVANGNYAIGYAVLNPLNLSLTDTSGSGQIGAVGSDLGRPFVVGLRDGCGAPVGGVTVTFAISGTPAGAVGQSLSSLTGATDAAGQVPITLTLGSKPGVYTVTAHTTGVSGMPAVFTATAAPGPVSRFTFASIGEQIETRPFTIVVTAEDAFSNTVTAYTAPVSLTDSAGAISPTLSDPFVNGVLTQAVVINAGGTDVVVTATHTATPTVTGVSNAFDVLPLRAKNLNTGEWFVTIQGAIDDSDTLDTHTISVTAALCDEQVMVNKNLTLRGAGAGQTILQGSGSGAGFTISDGAAGVTITGFTVTGYAYGVRLGAAAGAAITDVLIADTELLSNTSAGLYSNAVRLTDLTVRRVNASFNGLTGGYRRGIFLQNSGGTRRNVRIEGGVFNSNGIAGIDINLGTVDGLTVTDNIVQNNGDSGIGVYAPTSAWVYSNTVTDNGRFGIEIKNPAGDGTLNGPNHIVVMNNTVSRSVAATDARDHGGIVIIRRDVFGAAPAQPSGVVIVDNTVSGYERAPSGAVGDGIGISVAGLTHTVRGNIVFGNDVGIQVQGGNPSNPTGSADQSAPDDYFNRDNARMVGASLNANRVFANDVGVRAVVGTVTNTLLMSHNIITGNATVGVIFTGTGAITATLSGAAADYNTLLDNGAGGSGHISVTLSYTNPVILATYNDWGVTDLAAIEDEIHHWADDPTLGEVYYYDIVLADDGSGPMADGASYAVITGTLTGLLAPAGNVISFTTDLGVLGAVTGAAADGTVTTIITSTAAGTATITGAAGIGGARPMSDTTQVTFAPLTLDHFKLNSISDQMAGVGFQVVISACDASDQTLTGFNGWAVLADATATLVPTTPIRFHDGVWSGTVTVTQAYAGDVVTATYIHDASKRGVSNAFDVGHNAAATVTLAPASATLTTGRSITYTVWATDTYGNGWDATSSAAYTVTSGAGGSWSDNVYTAQYSGVWAVTAAVDGTQDTATLTVTPDGVAGVTVLPTSVSVAEGGVTAVYSVSLNSRPADSVTITVATDGQTGVTPTTLIFDARSWGTTRRVTVTAVDDDAVKGAHTGIINHTAVSADGNYNGIAITAVTANITDNDLPPALVRFSSGDYTVKETAGTATITVTLSTTSTAPVTVTYATGGGTATAGSDYVAVSGTLRFDIGQVSRTFSIPVFGDALPEGPETVNLVLSDPVNATLGMSEAVLTLTDNALYLPLVTRNHTGGYSGNVHNPSPVIRNQSP